MLTYLRDKLHAARSRARYQRIVQERLLALAETAGPQPVAEDPGRWTLLGDAKSHLDDSERSDVRSRARRLVIENPHARNVLRLLESYVVGPEFHLNHLAVRPGEADELVRLADRLWDEFRTVNHRHFSYREYARRTWRDGECFVRQFPSSGWPPSVRFVDPETIGPTPDHPESHGILTDPHDVETPVAYLRIDPSSGELLERIDAAEMFHTRINADSNEKRGVTLFAPVLDMLACFCKWLDTELVARKLQASIVLWRKVQGSPAQGSAFADQVAAGFDPQGAVRRERYRAGTILTTSHGTELQYLHPNTNFGDAVPLGWMLLLCVAAGTGLPEFMLTSDASNANYASTMVAEGPAVKLFQSEQEFFAAEFRQLWRWVMSQAVARGLLPSDFFDRIHAEWTFPQLVSRDRPRERLADARLVQTGVLSRAEVARRDGADPATMRSEIAEER